MKCSTFQKMLDQKFKIETTGVLKSLNQIICASVETNSHKCELIVQSLFYQCEIFVKKNEKEVNNLN